MSDEYVEYRLISDNRELAVKVPSIDLCIDEYIEAFREFLLAMTFREKSIDKGFEKAIYSHHLTSDN